MVPFIFEDYVNYFTDCEVPSLDEPDKLDFIPDNWLGSLRKFDEYAWDRSGGRKYVLGTVYFSSPKVPKYR